MRIYNLLNYAKQSRYFTNPGIVPNNAHSFDYPRSSEIAFQYPDYFTPYTPEEKNEILNCIAKSVPSGFNLKKVRFNRASKGFIVEASVVNKGNIAALKAIPDFVKAFNESGCSQRLLFERFIIHADKDGVKPGAIFIEMRDFSDMSAGEKGKNRLPDGEMFRVCRDMRMRVLESVINSCPENLLLRIFQIQRKAAWGFDVCLSPGEEQGGSEDNSKQIQ